MESLQKPLTPSLRFYIPRPVPGSKNNPEKSLVKSIHRSKGRNCYGRITSRRRGGGHKQLYRIVDFKRNKLDIPAKVASIEYDPNRNANIALLVYADGEKRYILAPDAVVVGSQLISSSKPLDVFNPGCNFQLKHIPLSSFVHNVELHSGKGGQLCRSAGTSAQLMAVEGSYATLKLASGELRLIHADCRATVGVVGNKHYNNACLGKAGRNRWLGRRPRVRAIAMNPVDHPMGGRTCGGRHPCSPWGQLAKGGKPSRKKSKITNKMILVRRNGKKFKK